MVQHSSAMRLRDSFSDEYEGKPSLAKNLCRLSEHPATNSWNVCASVFGLCGRHTQYTQYICSAFWQQISVCLAGKWTTCQSVIYGCAYLSSCNSILPSFLPPSLPPVDIREIRELRLGKGSRDFERYPEEARKLDTAHCFIVLYGLEFRLRTLSLAGQCVYTARVCVCSCDSHVFSHFTVYLEIFSQSCPLEVSLHFLSFWEHISTK